MTVADRVFLNSLGLSPLGLELIRWAKSNDYNAPTPQSMGNGSFTPEMAIAWITDHVGEDDHPYPTWTLLREELGFGPNGAQLIHEHVPGQWRLTALAQLVDRRQ